MQARRFFVRGRVQGVGYRYFVQREAEARRLTGYARNLADGRVEVYAAGEPAALAELAGLLWKGPYLSEVRDVAEEEAAVESRASFRIL
jgi:acylphosphatase